MKNLKRNEQDLEISPEIASETLKNVFEACEKPQNTIPLELLEEKHENQTKLYIIANIIASIGLIIVSFAMISYLTNVWKPGFQASIDTEQVLEKNEDLQPPSIINSELNDGYCVVELEQGSYPVDYDNIYGVDAASDNKFIIQHEENKLLLPYSKETKEIDIYIADIEGNKYHLLLKVF